MGNNLQLLNNTEHRVKFKTGSDINNALIQPTTTHSLSFNGTDQHGIISDLEINGAFTISMWIKLTDYQSNISIYPLFLKDYASKPTSDIFLDIGNGRLRASVYDRTGPWSTQISCQAAWQPNLLPNDVWHHVMMTYDGTVNSSAIKTFINGVENITNTLREVYNISSFNSVNSPADTDAYIGRGILNNRRFKGEMDQIAIWHSDQSANISSIYTGNTPANLTSLSPDHLFELNNNTNNSTGAPTLTLHGGGQFQSFPKNIKDPLVGEMLVETSRQSDISFDGQSKIDTDYTFGGGEISLSAWVKTTNPGSFIIASDSPTGQTDTSFAFGFKDSTTPYILIGNPGQQVYKTGPVTAINDGNWHNVIVTIDNSYVMNFYIDGVLETTHTFSTLPGASDYVTHYGSGWHDGIDPFYDAWGLYGKLNGLGIWERVLTGTEINAISSSGRYSNTAYHFSPDLWVGSTDPALYSCTDTSGTISKVTDLTVKMGDVPMLQLNDANLDVTNTFDLSSMVSPSDPNGYWGMSFWFKVLEVSPTGTQRLYINMGTTAGVYINTAESQPYVLLRDFGFLNPSGTNTPLVYGVDDTWYHPDKFHGNSPKQTSPQMYYEPGKLHNFSFVKKPSPISGKIRAEFWLDGELIGYINDTAAYYPWAPHLLSINPDNHDFSKVLFGDLAYWNSDASSIVDRMHNPSGQDKGYQGDYMNLSIQPYHYYKLGFSMNDLGTDGTNHLIPRQPLEETYSASVGGNSQFYMFTPEDGVMHGLSNGESEQRDPEMYMFVGDTMNITRPDSSHPLHIKDSSGNDVAVQNSTISNTYALSFNGSNHVDCGVLTALHGSPEMSLSFWFKSNTSGEGPSIGSRTGSSNQWGFLRGGGVNYVQVVTNNNGQYFSYTSPPDTNYHHYAITYNRGSIEFYIDGSPVSFSLTSQGSGATATLHSENTSFNIGKNDSFYSDGLFDEVSIFNSALTASDITYIYNRGATNDISSLNPIDWWRCGDDNLGSGTTITDQGVDSNGNPSGNDGSLVGNPTFSTDTPAAFITTFSPTIAGTYQYYCTSHSSMIGNINVQQRADYESIFGIDRSTES